NPQYIKRYQGMKKRPQTESEARKNMKLYLKNTTGYKMDFFKGMSYDEICPIFQARHGLGYENPYTLKKAISQNPKLYDASCFEDIKEMKDIFDSTEHDLNTIWNQNELLKDQLLEAKLKHEIKCCVPLSHKCVNNNVQDKIEKIQRDSIEIKEDELKFFLGLQVHQSLRGIFISQSQYATGLLKKHGLDDCVSMSTPMDTERIDVDLQGTPTDQMTYRRLIGGLIYLTASRPDIVFAIFFCACYQARPTVKHLKETQTIQDVKTIAKALQEEYNF
nr:putative RNA-directed DNA polymerase [Tanacetum cinerariifolium]